VDQSPSSEASSFEESQEIQEIPHTLWEAKVHDPVHNSPSLFPVFSQINPVHASFQKSYSLSWRNLQLLLQYVSMT